MKAIIGGGIVALILVFGAAFLNFKAVSPQDRGLEVKLEVEMEKEWEKAAQKYQVREVNGADGYYYRAIKGGFLVFHNTSKEASRFTRKTMSSPKNSCASCHTERGLAQSFANSDRVNAKVGRRVSFEESVQRCFLDKDRMDGFMPSWGDPVIRDLRIFARDVARHYELTEGSLTPKEMKEEGGLK